MFQDQHPEEGQTPNFKGSMIIVMANTAAEAKEILSKDVYVTEGVWDFDAAQIIPVRNMFPISLIVFCCCCCCLVMRKAELTN